MICTRYREGQRHITLPLNHVNRLVRSALRLLCVTTVAASCAVAQPTPRATAEAADEYNAVIVGGLTTLPQLADEVLSEDPYWVVLGAARSDGSVGALSPTACAATTVSFTLNVPPQPGAVVPPHTAEGLFVPWSVLAEWGAEPEQRPTFRRAGRLVPGQPADDLYCVAYIRPRLADVDAPQTVTARVVPPKDVITDTIAEARLWSESGGAGRVFEFPERRLDRSGGRVVIVDRSIGRRYGYVGSQLTRAGDDGSGNGTAAVILGIWDPATETVRPPTIAECARAQVRFALWSPTKAGVTAPGDTVGAVWVDGSHARILFPESTSRYFREVGTAEPSPSTRAARGGGDPTERAHAPYFCTAEAPLLLAENVGYQRVVADVVRSGVAPVLSVEETRRQPMRRGHGVNQAAPMPGGQAMFTPIRVHARPRALVGFAASTVPISIERDSTGTVTDDTRSALVAGFDFPVEPVLPFLRGARTLRLGVSTNVTGDPLDTFFLSLSAPSLFLLDAGENGVDIQLSVGLREGDEVLLGLGIMLDLDGPLKALSTPLGL